MGIGYNEDLSTEILLRLPPKSVLKFKSVSKLWLSIVSSPRFCCLHTSRGGVNPSPTGLLFKFINRGSKREKFDYVPLKYDNHRLHSSSFDYIIKGTTLKLTYKASCNGLLLFKGSNDRKYDGEYFVTNPTTKEFKIIPISRMTNNIFLENLAFDPSQSPHYNVLFVSFKYGNKLQMDVYSSENEICNPHKRNTLSFDLDLRRTSPTKYMQGIFCNGILHMLGLSWKDMLCFDLNKQCLIKCPVPPRSGHVLYYIKHSGGFIYLIVGEGSSIGVYLLKMDHSGWDLMCHLDVTSIAIDCQRIIPTFPSYCWCINEMSKRITRCSNLYEEEGPTMVFAAFDQLIAYNLTKKTTKIIGNVQSLYNRGFHSFSEVFPHLETLALV